MSASQTTMDKLYGMRLSVMAQAYRDQEEMLSVSSNLSRYHRSPGLVPAISKRRYRE